MSGPKCSEYSVKAELTEFFKQALEQECKLEEAQALIKRLMAELDAEASRERGSVFWRAEIDNLREFAKASISRHEKVVQRLAGGARASKAALDEKADGLIRLQKYNEASALIRQAGQSLMDMQARWSAELEADIASIEKELHSIARKYHQSAAFPVEKSKAKTRTAEKGRASPPLLDQIHMALDEAEHICTGLPPELADKYLERLAQARENSERYNEEGRPAFLEKLLHQTIPAIADAAQTEARRHTLLKKRIERQIIRYNALCGKKNRAPLPALGWPVDEDYAQEMDARIETLQNELVKDREQKYIHETVDRLLREMGHQTLGERYYPDQSAPELYCSKVYGFREGTAVKASFSSFGEVVLEIVGLSESQRPPSASEATRLRGDMREFCGEYAKIKKNLELMGIVMDNIYECPATERYAKIENLSAYRQAAGVSAASFLIDSLDEAPAAEARARYFDEGGM